MKSIKSSRKSDNELKSYIIKKDLFDRSFLSCLNLY